MRKAIKVSIFFMILSIIISSVLPASVDIYGQHKKPFKNRNKQKSIGANYLLYLPKDYDKDGRLWPLIVYLHGASVRGDKIERIKRYGLPMLLEKKEDFPFIVISPQCPRGKYWDSDEIISLIDEVESEYPIDKEKIYLTGVSLGGHGTWAAAGKYPDKFAAIAPLCGRGDTLWAETLKNVPSWVFHGSKDRKCPIYYSENLVNAITSKGGEVKFTIYPKRGHRIDTETYQNPELYQWFLSHSRKSN